MSIQDLGILVGIVAGTSGAVLGIVNYLHQRDLTRPKVRVRPMIRTIITESGEIDHSVGIMEVANVGHLPIHCSTIGFYGPKKDGPGGIIKNPEPLDGRSWPRTLEPRTAVWLRFNLGSLVDEIDEIELGKSKGAFVTSIIDESFRTSRKHMKRFCEEIANWRDRKLKADATAEDAATAEAT